MHSLNEQHACPLSYKEAHELNFWLHRVKKGNSLFRAEGFLCAVFTSPIFIPQTSWLPKLLTTRLAKNVHKPEHKPFLDMLLRLHYQVANSLMRNPAFYPSIDFYPMLPFTAERITPQQRESLRQWCLGYAAGLRLEKTSWKPLHDFQKLYFTLRILKQKKVTARSIVGSNIEITSGQVNTAVAGIIESIPVLLGLVYDQSCAIACPKKENKKLIPSDINSLSKFANPKNAPCPCNSSKPFTRCCEREKHALH